MTDAPGILGLHHVTAITGDPQKNLDFYCGFLGLRLVKLTVNFDDPGAYHLYYGDASGTPGSLITFFAWPGAFSGRRGAGQAIVASFTIPQSSFGYWIERCLQWHVPHAGPLQKFDESYLLVHDPDGLAIELVAHPKSDSRKSWEGGAVPAEHAIRGLHSATLFEEGYVLSAKFLTDDLGFRLAKEENNVFRFEAGDGGPGSFFDVKCTPDLWKGVSGTGTIHHIAMRVTDDEAQKAWRAKLLEKGANVSPVMERTYFRSIYFSEPGGILYEIATDGPGFTADQSTEELGSKLSLPVWLEPQRPQIEEALPHLRLPPFPWK